MPYVDEAVEQAVSNTIDRVVAQSSDSKRHFATWAAEEAVRIFRQELSQAGYVLYQP